MAIIDNDLIVMNGSNVNVVQETGQSTINVMSQKSVTDNLDNKLDIDGYSAQAGVGVADNLAGRGDGVGASFIYRTTGGSADVADGAASIKSIKGNTIIWNQLVDIDTVTVVLITDHKYYFYDKDGTSAIIIGDGSQQEVAEGDDMLCDLTRMFGAGNEPSTVAEFNSMFPNDYYDYNAGSLLSFVGNGIKTVGFNQWDGVSVYNGRISSSKPTIVAATADTPITSPYINVTQFGGPAIMMRCIAEQTYHIGGTVTNVSDAYWYVGFYAKREDATDYTKCISAATILSNGVSTVTAPVGANYIVVMRWCIQNVSVAWSNLCINYSWSGYRNGEYEDYWTQTRNLPTATYFTGGMKSVGADHDELTSTKSTQRIGSRAYVSGDENDNTVLTDGTNTLYVLETPVVTDISPEINLSYIVSDFGTEEILTADNAMTAPCEMTVVYGMNAVDTMSNLPTNYISKESFDEFCAALETAFNCTVTASWNSSTGKYTFTIVNNGG